MTKFIKLRKSMPHLKIEAFGATMLWYSQNEKPFFNFRGLAGNMMRKCRVLYCMISMPQSFNKTSTLTTPSLPPPPPPPTTTTTTATTTRPWHRVVPCGHSGPDLKRKTQRQRRLIRPTLFECWRRWKGDVASGGAVFRFRWSTTSNCDKKAWLTTPIKLIKQLSNISTHARVCARPPAEKTYILPRCWRTHTLGKASRGTTIISKLWQTPLSSRLASLIPRMRPAWHWWAHLHTVAHVKTLPTPHSNVHLAWLSGASERRLNRQRARSRTQHAQRNQRHSQPQITTNTSRAGRQPNYGEEKGSHKKTTTCSYAMTFGTIHIIMQGAHRNANQCELRWLTSTLPRWWNFKGDSTLRNWMAMHATLCAWFWKERLQMFPNQKNTF